MSDDKKNSDTLVDILFADTMKNTKKNLEKLAKKQSKKLKS